jgi:hypothetical protein
MASIVVEFEGEQWHILHPHMSPDLPAHIVGQAYCVTRQLARGSELS